MIDRTPEEVSLSTDLHEHLIQVPLPLSSLAHPFRSPLSDLVSKVSTETINPLADRFMANVDPSLVKQVFDIA